ncbi:MAG: hypothetical protein H7175_22080 [Burkholderiales bacterium]|nr:hypothetical protein [Anaerolineae bacterium]
MATGKLRKDELDNLNSLAGGGVMTDEEIQRILKGYEQQFGMSSEEFLKKWAEDAVPDTADTMEWMIVASYWKRKTV